jgi:dienelactone hydrolase
MHMLANGRVVGLALVAVLAAAGCGGGSSSKTTAATTATVATGFTMPSPDGTEVTGPLGSGAHQAWLFRPKHRAPRALVILVHGSGDVDPENNMRPWIDHLTAQGDAVIYPRYEVSREHDDRGHVVSNLIAGVRRGAKALNAPDLPVVVVGFSWGARLAMDYAAAARSLDAPAPSSVLSVFPSSVAAGDQFASLSHLDRSLRIILLVGDQDHDVGNLGAKEILSELEQAGFPPDHVEARLLKSRQGFTVDHLAPLGASADVLRAFWTPADKLVAAARAAPS